MQALKVHCVYGLIIVCLVPLFLHQSHYFDKDAPAEPIRNLHELAVHLFDNGVHLRAVPQRADGLWLEALYLTQTEQNPESLQGLAIDPKNIDKWKGTVIVFEDGPISRRDSSDWGENRWHWRKFFFYGDKEVLKLISRALDR